MTRLAALMEGLGSAEDALAPVRRALGRDMVPTVEDVEGAIMLLGFAVATLRGALTLPMGPAEMMDDPVGEMRMHRSAVAGRHAGTLTRRRNARSAKEGPCEG